jgi:3-isopropylmalate dehydrogenase
MMLEYLGFAEAATSIVRAVTASMEAGQTTKDLGGSLGTKAAGEAILTRLR